MNISKNTVSLALNWSIAITNGVLILLEPTSLLTVSYHVVYALHTAVEEVQELAKVTSSIIPSLFFRVSMVV